MQNLKGNVGRQSHRHCRNSLGDQLLIMTLLNRIPAHFGGTGGNLHINPIEGKCPDQLYEAILRFQEVNIASIKPDGIIEPDGITLHFLNRLAARSFPMKKIEDFVIDSFVEDLYEDTLVEAYRDRVQANEQNIQSLHAKPFCN